MTLKLNREFGLGWLISLAQKWLKMLIPLL